MPVTPGVVFSAQFDTLTLALSLREREQEKGEETGERLLTHLKC